MIFVDYLMFADIHEERDGRPRLISMEYDRIWVPAFPLTYTLQVVFRLRALWADAGAPVTFSLEITDSAGARVREPLMMQVALPHEPDTPTGADVSRQFCLTIPPLVFRTPGTYTVAARANGNTPVTRNLHVLDRASRSRRQAGTDSA